MGFLFTWADGVSKHYSDRDSESKAVSLTLF